MSIDLSPGTVALAGAAGDPPSRPGTAPPEVAPTVRQRLDALPAGTFTRCPGCAGTVYTPKLTRNLRVCPECGYHLRLPLAERLAVLFDADSFTEYDADLAATDPLGFTDSVPYPQRLAAARRKTGRSDAAVYGSATVGGLLVAAAVLDFDFIGGSMGSVVGEKVARAAELALARGTPLITCSCSGGARMQEGVYSLLQMARTAAAVRQLSDAGLPHFSVLVDPVYGGVSASYANLADVILAEPDARAGFAGPQVIAQTTRQELPAGFQRAEYLLAHGHIDAVVPRPALPATLARLVAFHDAARRGVRVAVPPDPVAVPPDPVAVPPVGAATTDAWERVRLARHPQRPYTDDVVAALFDDVVELRGDRLGGDDPAMLAALARLDGAPVVVVGHRKGRGTTEAVARNFGMAGPAGYRKARRLLEYAERFGVPVVMLVDTPGADPGVAAEAANQSGAIAANLAVLAGLRTPLVAAVIGEGGSGGALAIGVADRLLMLENATLSVISPEGCASILFGDAAQAPRAARALRLSAPELAAAGLVSEIVAEPAGGAHTDPAAAVEALGAALRRQLAALAGTDPELLVKSRLERLRTIGPVRPSADGGTHRVPAASHEAVVPQRKGEPQ